MIYNQFGTMTVSKQADRFERVYAQINRIKSIKAGPASREDLRGVLEKCNISITEWGSALQYAKVNTPNLYENFLRSMGKIPKGGADAPPDVSAGRSCHGPSTAGVGIGRYRSRRGK